MKDSCPSRVPIYSSQIWKKINSTSTENIKNAAINTIQAMITIRSIQYCHVLHFCIRSTTNTIVIASFSVALMPYSTYFSTLTKNRLQKSVSYRSAFLRKAQFFAWSIFTWSDKEDCFLLNNPCNLDMIWSIEGFSLIPYASLQMNQ